MNNLLTAHTILLMPYGLLNSPNCTQYAATQSQGSFQLQGSSLNTDESFPPTLLHPTQSSGWDGQGLRVGRRCLPPRAQALYWYYENRFLIFWMDKGLVLHMVWDSTHSFSTCDRKKCKACWLDSVPIDREGVALRHDMIFLCMFLFTQGGNLITP